MKAIVAMSGGVDSSVAAFLMKEQGFSCIGATMKLFYNGEIGLPDTRTCCSLDDVQDAREVAYSLQMPHYVFNFSERFRERVIERFAAAYEQGETPNPCIDCNRYLKFDALYHRMEELSCDKVATGHYARVEYDKESGRWLLKKGIDPERDQSYVLYTLTQRQLAHTCFPLGGMKKDEVRAKAEQAGFLNAKKRDSQDICFVPDGDYAGFIERYRGSSAPAGDFIDREGHILGRHRGIIRYTIGQRKGLGLSFPQPMYVCAVDPAANTVTLGEEAELYHTALTAREINLISLPVIERPMRLKAKVRYRQREEWATVTQPTPETLFVKFDTPQRAMTCGQAVVLYDGDTVVGGGRIAEVSP